MKRKTVTLTGLMALILLLSDCSDRRGTVEIRVVATSDVHGRYYSIDALDGSERKGSLAGFSTFLKRQRKECGNLVYLDAGDMLSGSVEAYHDITAEFYEPSLAATVYNRLGCDAAVLGNHEFSEGADVYMRFLEACGFPVLGANLMYDNPGDFLPPYCIIERHGVRIAVVGFTVHAIRYTVPADILGSVVVSDIVESARYWMPIIRKKEKPDVIIGLLHCGLEGGRFGEQGIEENAARHLAADVPGFDIIVFGHDHTPYCGNVECSDGKSVLLLNPGAYAEKAAVADISVTFSKGEQTGGSVVGKLCDITGEEPDKEFAGELKPRYDKMCHYTDSLIGQLGAAIDCSGYLWRTTSGMDFIHYFQKRFQAAEISLATPVSPDMRAEAGDFTIRDAFRVYPYENKLVSLMLRGSEVKDILEYSASCFYNTVGNGNVTLLKTDGSSITGSANHFISACGIDYTIDVTRKEGDMVRIISMSDGKPFDMNRYYRTTMNSFLVCGATSPLYDIPGFTRDDILRRIVVVSGADMRYFIITDFNIKTESGKPVSVTRNGNWCLVPEKTVREKLASDTVNIILR